jgi:hypothetical protein
MPGVQLARKVLFASKCALPIYRRNRTFRCTALAFSEAVTLEALKDGKIRVNSSSWAEPAVLLPNETLEARWVDGQLNLVRAPRAPEPKISEPAKDFEEFV